MHDPETFEARLASAVRRYAADDPRHLDSSALARAIAADAGAARPTGLGARLGPRPMPATLRVLLAAALILLLAAGAAIVGSQLLEPAPVPVVGRFSWTGPMAVHRHGHTTTLLLDGTVLVVGSDGDENGSEALAETWDPATDRFTPAGSLIQARFAHSATRLQDGRVLIVGGRTPMGETLLASAEIWDPRTRTFAATGSLAQARSSATASLRPDGSVLISGGTDGTTSVTVERWDPVTGLFSPADAPAAAPKGVTLLDGRVLVVTGQTVEIWDPTSEQLTAGGTLIEDRSFHADETLGPTATTLRDGRILIAGGSVCTPTAQGTLTASLDTALGGCTVDALGTAEIWDPTTLTSVSTGQLRVPRHGHTATLLADGRVLMVGNYSVNGNTAEVFELQ